MRKYRAGELEEYAKNFDKSSRAFDVYMELARRLRQEEEENRRDPVKDPRMGDRMIMPCGWEWVCVPSTGNYAFCHEKQWQRERRLFPSATIVRRREVQQ